jgi:hypothetical protein
MFMHSWNKQQRTLPVTHLCERSGLQTAVDTPVSSRLLFCVVHSFEFLCLIKHRTLKTLWKRGCSNPRTRDLGTNEGDWFLCNPIYPLSKKLDAEYVWNLMAHGDAREGKWRGNWRMERVASTLHTTSEPGVSSIATADAHTSAASSRLNWRPRLFKWTRPFRRKTKSGFCTCAIAFQTHCNSEWVWMRWQVLLPLFGIQR